jgi:two-component system response regulator DegU
MQPPLPDDPPSTYRMSDAARTRVLLVDDHAPFREGAAAVLRLEGGVDVVGEASDGAEALEFLERHPVDVVLMDIDMPRLDGLEATGQITERYPETQVVILSGANAPELMDAAKDAGAKACLCKSELADLGTQVLELTAPR